jgi:hypothetical protein
VAVGLVVLAVGAVLAPGAIVGADPQANGIATPSSYLTVTGAGAVNAFGGAALSGSAAGLALSSPIAGMATVRPGCLVVPSVTAHLPCTIIRPGYWLVSADGGVFAYGGAGFFGSLAGTTPADPVVGIAATPDDLGYWIVTSDGGVHPFGDATTLSPTSGLSLNAPIVGIVSTASTPAVAAGVASAAGIAPGYWLVAADGGVFAYGAAAFEGSAGVLRLDKPVVGMTVAANGLGYWLVAADGGVFAYGAATFEGSMGGMPLAAKIVGIASASSFGSAGSAGYWMVGADGGVFAFGSAQYGGSLAGQDLRAPVVGIASVLPLLI